MVVQPLRTSDFMFRLYCTELLLFLSGVSCMSSPVLLQFMAITTAIIVTLHFTLPKYDHCVTGGAQTHPVEAVGVTGSSICVQILIVTVYRTVQSPQHGQERGTCEATVSGE